MKVAKPFWDLNLAVCFVALVPNEDTLLEFQWSPELMANEQVAKSIPLYIAVEKERLYDEPSRLNCHPRLAL